MKGTPYLIRTLDWLEPGDPSYAGLLHSDRSDSVQICPAQLGQGYVQSIPLRDDLNLVIIDYTLNQPLLIDAPREHGLLEFEFQLAGREPGQSLIMPYFGLRGVGVRPAHQRLFKVELFFKSPTLNTYFQDFTQGLSASVQQTIEAVLQQLCRQRWGQSPSSFVATLDRLMSAPSGFPRAFEQMLPADLYSDIAALDAAFSQPMTPAMQTVIGQILSCPYHGSTRRAYLEGKALELVSLRLDAVNQAAINRLSGDDCDRIYQAETILRHQLHQPPSVEALARQVALNRLKLNQGFHQIFGTTPYGHLRHCRLQEARRLLMTTDLAIEQVAQRVGYTSRSRFASAFRQEYGLNPKVFQMQCWALAG